MTFATPTVIAVSRGFTCHEEMKLTKKIYKPREGVFKKCRSRTSPEIDIATNRRNSIVLKYPERYSGNTSEA